MTALRLPALPRLARKPLLLAALLIVAGCARDNVIPPPTQPGPLDGMPAANSPSGVVSAFLWCNQNRSTEGYGLLFTDDFQFAFAALDTNGNAFRDDWNRERELVYFDHLVNGGAADQPAASQITLVFDRSFRVQNDTRAGKYDPDRRKTITTQVNLMIQTTDGTATNVNGKATFYLVRGDSARIPEDLDLGADPERWYIERWEDQTLAGSGATSAQSGAAPRPLRAQPTKNATWGSIKARYL